MSSLKRQIIRWSAVIVALFNSTACDSAGLEPRMVMFGPPGAEAEIRTAFGISGEMPTIDELIRAAELRHMNHEAMIHDRSLTYCHVGRNRDELTLEMFYGGRDAAKDAVRNYLAAYTADRRVVCIETRHAYPAL